MPESVLVDYDIVGGNSGGPVLDDRGNVIGIVSWGYTIADQAYSINGAVSSYVATAIIDKIAATGADYPTPYLGIDFEPMGMIHTIQYNMPPTTKVEGVFITNVAGGSPAAACGLAPGMVITHVDGVLVGKSNNQVPFGTQIHFKNIGAEVALTVRRRPYGRTEIIKARLAPIPKEKDLIFSGTQSVKML